MKGIIELVIGIIKATNDCYKERSDKLVNSEPELFSLWNSFVEQELSMYLFTWVTLAERVPNVCFTLWYRLGTGLLSLLPLLQFTQDPQLADDPCWVTPASKMKPCCTAPALTFSTLHNPLCSPAFPCGHLISGTRSGVWLMLHAGPLLPSNQVKCLSLWTSVWVPLAQKILHHRMDCCCLVSDTPQPYLVLSAHPDEAFGCV